MSAAAPSPRRSTARPAVAPRPGIRVVPAPTPRAPRAPFVAVVLMFLIAGLGSLLLLNTLLAQGSFTVQTLSLQVAALQDREQALQQRVAALDSPRRLARQAAALGMVTVVNPAFLRVTDGRILGVPEAAIAPPPAVTTHTDPDESAVVTQDGARAADTAGDRASPQPGPRQNEKQPQGDPPDKGATGGDTAH